ncbi:T-cell antigen CD7 [Ambystoma mexicanum]|uniref:T-cell antigen CD7 n=1 Tax=Ambystoma mexicanum TaxID=8296 RepID=UPI0037E99A7F
MKLNRRCPVSVCSILLLLCSFSHTGEGCEVKINQSPTFIFVSEGASITITCVTTVAGKQSGMNVKRRHRELMYFNQKSQLFSRDGNEFSDRADVSGTSANLTITLHNLRKDDSDFYLCDCVVGEYIPTDHVCGGGTVLIVTGEEVNAWTWQNSLLLTLAFVILIVCAVIIIKYKSKRKQGNWSRQEDHPRNTVYEDMTRFSRCNTMTRPLVANAQNPMCNNILDNSPPGSHYVRNMPKGVSHGSANMPCHA